MGRPKKNIQPTKPVEKKEYKIRLVANGIEYFGTGNSVTDALDSIGLSYLNIKTKGTLFIEKGGNVYERFYFLRNLRRLLHPAAMVRKGLNAQVDAYFKLKYEI